VKIPAEIFFGHIDHTEPFTGDNGITFKDLKNDSTNSRTDSVSKGIQSAVRAHEDGVIHTITFTPKTLKITASVEVPLPEQFRRKRPGMLRKVKVQR
jgi:hypothetical protein